MAKYKSQFTVLLLSKLYFDDILVRFRDCIVISIKFENYFDIFYFVLHFENSILSKAVYLSFINQGKDIEFSIFFW